MRRRQKDDARIGGRSQLMDARNWERCDRWDGETQPCLCWFSIRQRELVAAGQWPGGVGGELADYLEMTQQHDCNLPFDRAAI